MNTHNWMMNRQNDYSFCISSEIPHQNNDKSWNPVLLPFLPLLVPSGFSLLNNRVSCLLMLLSWRHVSCFSGCTGASSSWEKHRLESSVHFTRKPLMVRCCKVIMQKVASVAGSHLLSLAGCICRRLRCVRGCSFYKVQPRSMAADATKLDGICMNCS